MKLRIRHNQTSFYIADVTPSTRLDQLKAVISDRLTQEGIFLTVFDISLNGKTPLHPTDPNACISDLGIVSGDAIRILPLAPTRTFDTSKGAERGVDVSSGDRYDVLRSELCNMDFTKDQIEFAISNFPGGLEPTSYDLVNIILTSQEAERCEQPDTFVSNENEIESENMNLQSIHSNVLAPTQTASPVTKSHNIKNIDSLMAELCPGNAHQSLCLFFHVLMLKHKFKLVSPLFFADSDTSLNPVRLEYKHDMLLTKDTSLFVLLVSLSADSTNINICLDTSFTVSHTLKLSTYIDYHSPEIFILPKRLSYEITRMLISPLLKQLQELYGNGAAGLDKLCPELLLKVVSLLDLHSLVSLSCVNHRINELSQSPSIWRNLLSRDFPRVAVHGVMDYLGKYKQEYTELKRVQRARREQEYLYLEQDPVPMMMPPPGPFVPSHIPGPGHNNPLIIGGSHDLDPFSLPSFPFPTPSNPLGGRGGLGMRPRFDPIGPIPGMYPNPGRNPRWGQEPPDGNTFGPYL